MNTDEILKAIQAAVAIYGLRILAALAIVLIGRWIALALKRVLVRVFEKRKLEPTIAAFVVNLGYVALLTFVILAALSQLGVETTSFVAVIGAAGLAIGLALQGAL